MRPRSLVLDTVTRAALPTVMVFSLYLLFVGHNAPGGGFIAGLVAGAGLVLRYLGRGRRGLEDLVSVPFDRVLGAGLMVAGGTGAASWAFGAPFLSSSDVHVHVPVLGDIHLVSPLAFDIGVYLVVVGLVLGVLTVLGDPPTPEHGPGPDDRTRAEARRSPVERQQHAQTTWEGPS